jgi:hypothetical protein
VRDEPKDAQAALALAAGLVLDAVAEHARIVPGQELGVTSRSGTAARAR